MAKLHFYGTETTFINWLRSFLTDKKQSAQTHHLMALGTFSQPRNNKMWIFPRVNSSVLSFHNTGCICALRLYVPMYTRVNKNPSVWNFLSPKPEVTFGTVAIIIRVVLLYPYLRIRAVSLSSIHYNKSHRVYINRRRQYICLIWN